MMVDVDIIAAYSDGPAVQAYWLGPEAGDLSALFCSYQILK